jgi:hypothetical protein
VSDSNSGIRARAMYLRYRIGSAKIGKLGAETKAYSALEPPKIVSIN